MTKPTTQTLSERFAKYSGSTKAKKSKKTSEKTKPQPNKPKVAFKKTRPNKKQNKKKVQLSADQLDKDLDDYRRKDKDAFKLILDKELEEYSKGAPAVSTGTTE